MAKWTKEDTKELRDFAIQMITLRSLNGNQANRLCDLINNACERIKELEEKINLAIGGIDALSGDWDEETKKDILAIKQTLEATS